MIVSEIRRAAGRSPARDSPRRGWRRRGRGLRRRSPRRGCRGAGRSVGPVVVVSCLPVRVELGRQFGVGGVLRCEPAVAQSASAFNGGLIGAGDPICVGWRARGEIVALTTSNERPDAVTVSPSSRARTARGHGFLSSCVRALLDGETVTASGRSFEVVNATISPRARQPTQIWIAGTNETTVEHAGRLGDGWLTAQNATDTELATQLDSYRQTADRHNRPTLPVLRRDIHVAATDAEARAHVDAILAKGYRGLDHDRLLVGISRHDHPSAAPLRVDRLRSRHGPPHHRRPQRHDRQLRAPRRSGRGRAPNPRRLVPPDPQGQVGLADR